MGNYKVIIADSRCMEEIEDGSVHLIVTSPPYPMIEMWDSLFRKLDERIDKLWYKLDCGDEKIVRKIFELMHKNLAKVWMECYRILVDGGIACINIGDATRSINGVFRIFPNHSKIIEICENIGFFTLPYILWKKTNQ